MGDRIFYGAYKDPYASTSTTPASNPSFPLFLPSSPPFLPHLPQPRQHEEGECEYLNDEAEGAAHEAERALVEAVGASLAEPLAADHVLQGLGEGGEEKGGVLAQGEQGLKEKRGSEET